MQPVPMQTVPMPLIPSRPLPLCHFRGARVCSLFLAASLAAGPGASGALAGLLCASQPRMSWLSVEEVQLRLSEYGLHLVKLRLGSDRCYAVVARDAKGQMRDLVMHPVTSEIMN